MLRTDTPLLKAAAEAAEKNEAEKAEHDDAPAAEAADSGEMGKIAAMAMDYAKTLLSIDHSKMAESAEYKSLMAALEALASAAAKPAEKMDHDDEEKGDEEKGDAEKADADAASDDEARKMDHGDEEKKDSIVVRASGVATRRESLLSRGENFCRFFVREIWPARTA